MISEVNVLTFQNPDIMEVDHLDSWMTLMITYMTTRVLPEKEMEARKISRQSFSYAVIKGKLYKKSIGHPWLKCVDLSKGDYLVREIHEVKYGSHKVTRAVI